MTFKPGDKVYIYRFGIVELIAHDNPRFPLKAPNKGTDAYSLDGKILPSDKHPSIFTLEFAERRGLVRKRTMRHKRQVKYRDTRDNSVNITSYQYEDKWDFEYRLPNYLLFMHFVDEQGNRCVVPEDTFEWEETLNGYNE
jgi:hypothetical protein